LRVSYIMMAVTCDQKIAASLYNFFWNPPSTSKNSVGSTTDGTNLLAAPGKGSTTGIYITYITITQPTGPTCWQHAKAQRPVSTLHTYITITQPTGPTCWQHQTKALRKVGKFLEPTRCIRASVGSTTDGTNLLCQAKAQRGRFFWNPPAA
jgi:hypothetical protein